MFTGRVRHNRVEVKQSVVGVPSIFHSDGDDTGEAIGGGCVWWQGGYLGKCQAQN